MHATSAVFEGDDHPLVAHAAAVVADGSTDDRSAGTVVSVGTIFPEPPPWALERIGAWRIRGMATAEGVRGQGVGGQVLARLLAHAREHGGSLVWCHARAGGYDFYGRAGFVGIGEEFDDGFAIHRSMYLEMGPP
jgi:GNAT superfamily N-acetyltransferase